VESRSGTTALDAMRDSVVGYESCIPIGENVKVDFTKVRYALLPVWLLSTKWKDQNYLFAINGQTGRLVGDLPVSRERLAAWFGGIFAATAVIMSLIRFLFL
jgi:hypothetical protein